MNGIVAWWAKNPIAANLLMVALLGAGLVAYFTMDRELEPHIKFPGAQISVAWFGAGPKDIEEQITTRLEEAISRIEGVEELWSMSRESMGTLWVLGERTLDQDAFLARVKREIDAIPSFPPAAERPQITPFSSNTQIMRLVLYGDVDARILQRYGEKMRRELALLPHVPSAVLSDTRAEEVSIEVSEDMLRQYGLRFSDIAAAVRQASINVSSGNLRTEIGDMQLRTRQLADSKQDFERIIVRQTQDGATILLGDVAKIIDGFADVNLRARFDGHRAIMINVRSGPNMDVVKMAEEVKAYIKKTKPLLPGGMSVHLWDDASEHFTDRISTILWNFLTGLLLVVATLLLFLRPIIAFWVSVGIAISFAGGLAFLPINGVSFNMISTFAFLLVIGVVVDDAIIVGEAIHRENEHGRYGVTAAIAGTKMVIKPVIFAVLTTMIFFAPWMFLSGPTREFTRAISLVVILALAFSLIESLFILPAHLAHLKPINPKNALAKFQKKMADSIVSFAHHTYRPAIVWSIKHHWITAAAFLAAFIMSIGLMSQGVVKFTFMPETESNQIKINIQLPDGTPYARSLDVLAQIEAAKNTLQDEVVRGGGVLVENWYVRSRETQILGLLKLADPNMRAMSAKQTALRLRQLIGPIPGAQQIQIEYRDGNTDPAIEYVLNSDDLDDLAAATNELMTQLQSYEGVYNVVNDSQSAADEIQFTLKPGAQSLGITITDIATQIRQGFYGIEVQRLPRNGQDVRVYVRYPKENRESLDYLKNMRIRTNDGRELPLFVVADLSFGPGVSRILRRERQRAVVISAEAAAERVSDVRKDMKKNYLKAFAKAHPNVRRSLIGRAKSQSKFLREILILSGGALALAYILLAIAFRSYGEPWLILGAAIPFCYMGAVLGHLAFGLHMTVFSFLGMMAAAGVAVNDNLVLLDYVHRLRASGMGGARALVEAGVERFRPILLTSLTTFVGLMPLMLEQSIQAAFLIPVGLSLAFGVLLALFVTLFLVPSLYAIGADIRRMCTGFLTDTKVSKFGESLSGFDAEKEVDIDIPISAK